MNSPRARRARTTLAALACSCILLTVALLTACAEEERTRGQLIVAITSDMPLPKDINLIKIEVTVQGQRYYYDEHRVGPDELRLPATLGIIEGTKGNLPVTITVGAFQDRTLRLVRQAVTSVPPDRAALLVLTLEWLCDGFGEEVPSSDGLSSRLETGCPDGQTCIGGACESNFVDPSSLPDYDPALVFGGADGPGPDGMCFDALACFETGLSVLPRWDANASTCRIDRPSGDRVNVALELPGGGDGICKSERCLIVLDGLVQHGFQPAGSGAEDQLALPARACRLIEEGIVSGVLVSTDCPTKTTSVPLCGLWSSVGSGGDSTGNPDPNPMNGTGGTLTEPPPPGSFSFYTLPIQHIRRGEELPVRIEIARGDGFTAAVDLTVPTPPTGVSAQGARIASGRTRASVTLSAGATAPLGLFDSTVLGKAGDVEASLPWSLLVGGPMGSLDTSFGTDGFSAVAPEASGDIVGDMIVDAEDRILLTGRANGQFAVFRYLPDGTPDSSFGTAGKVTVGAGLGRKLLVLADGAIVAGGSDGSSPAQGMIAKLTAAGVLDTSFGASGLVTRSDPSYVTTLAAPGNGKVVFGGSGGLLYRLTSTGQLDTTFGASGYVNTGATWLGALRIAEDGDILALAWIPGTAVQLQLSRLSSAGAEEWKLTGLPSAYGDTLLVQPDGKILLQGHTYPAPGDYLVARVTAGGALDSTFGTGGIALIDFHGGEDDADSLVLLGDGRIVLGGFAANSEGLARAALAGLTATGALDPSFGSAGKTFFDWPEPNLAAGLRLLSLGLQSDGRIVLAASRNSSRVITRVWP
jgi:uncharacterized delta-60 repeat protein